MLVTFALVIFLFSIVVFFSEEFGRLLKKIFKIPGLKLLLPLILASFFVEMFEGMGHWVLTRCQVFIHQLIYTLSKVIPSESMGLISARILYLFLVASLPIWYFHYRAKKRGQREPQIFAYRLGLLLWIIASMLLTVA